MHLIVGPYNSSKQFLVRTFLTRWEKRGKFLSFLSCHCSEEPKRQGDASPSMVPEALIDHVGTGRTVSRRYLSIITWA